VVKKKQVIMAETISLMLFLPPTKSCQAPAPSMWAFKRGYVRGMVRLMYVRNVLNSFILYSIDKFDVLTNIW